MKRTLFLLIAQCIGIASMGQGFSCTTGEMSQQQYDNHPELLAAKRQLDSFTREYTAHHHPQAARSSSATYVVPVVFHILHDGGNEVITDDVIYNEMAHWNQYFNQNNPELPSIVSAFKNLIGNGDVEFRLARRDPQGNCTNGIDRIYTQSTYVGSNNTKMRPWPREKYLNVWVVKGLWDATSRTSDTSGYGVLAFSMYPPSVATYTNGDIIDGIITKWQEVGSNIQFSRPTLAHEAGHWLNLQHTWGNDNSPGKACGDDEVKDTPLTLGDQNTCNTNEQRCTAGVIENVQNIMNYADCHVMFTQGQVDRMHAAINSPVSGRNNIWTDSNLIATGVKDTTQPICAVPIADFTADLRSVCLGTTVALRDVSYNATVDSREWIIPSDALASSTIDENITVQFSTPGWKDITLKATNTNGTGKTTKTMIYVSDETPIVAPAFENFEDPATATKWQAINYDNNNTYFNYYNKGGFYSKGSYQLNNYYLHYDGDRDGLVSPPYDMTGLSGTDLNLTFRYSYLLFNINDAADSIGSLSVFATTDCGTTWRRVFYKTGYGLYQGILATPYAANPTQEFWTKVSINLPTLYQKPDVRFRFQVQGKKNGNNFYIDNINVGNAADLTAINDPAPTAIDRISVIPNPANETAKLMISLTQSTTMTIHIVDMMGQQIASVYQGALSEGGHELSLPIAHLATGLYSVIVNDGRTTRQTRFCKY